ncbi:MAG TPA: hypothetical protein VMU37_05445 [Caulobacteraceae bacterium]|nr:hypothetical protein [Caulobacteraceae bacterium]
MGPATALALSLVALASEASAGPSVIFDTTRLGASLAAWRAAPPPPGIDPTARPLCSNDPVLAAAKPNPLSGESGPTSGLACGYFSVLGRYALWAQLPLVGPFRATRVRFLFRGGRLADVDCDASIDAFNDLTAFLDQTDGPPVEAVRDVTGSKPERFAQVRMTWARAGSIIQLTDPAPPDYDHLDVRIEAPPASWASR